MNVQKNILFIIVISLWVNGANAGLHNTNPCDGLLALVNRPTGADSACVVPSGNVVTEMGYEYQTLHPQNGWLTFYPQLSLRFGLPKDFELFILPPNYTHLRQPDYTTGGLSTMTIGAKHQFGYYQDKWLISAEALLILPGGSAGFGSAHLGATTNAIIDYSFNQALSAMLLLGVTSQTLPVNVGGGRFFSIDPDLILCWQPINSINLYGEVYGQTKTAPNQGAGWNTDVGLLYLLNKHVEVDFEAGRRISGNLAQLNYFVGAGFAIWFV